MYAFRERKAALDAAVALFSHTALPPTAELVLVYAADFLGWVSGARLHLTADPVTYTQGPAGQSQATRYTGGKVQLTDTQQVSLAVEPEDSKGEPTSDTLTLTTANPAVVSLQPSADGLSCLCVAGAPGLGAVVTVSDGTISATESFDVLAGAVASLVITPGTPEDQPPVTPPAPVA